MISSKCTERNRSSCSASTQNCHMIRTIWSVQWISTCWNGCRRWTRKDTSITQCLSLWVTMAHGKIVQTFCLIHMKLLLGFIDLWENCLFFFTICRRNIWWRLWHHYICLYCGLYMYALVGTPQWKSCKTSDMPLWMWLLTLMRFSCKNCWLTVDVVLRSISRCANLLQLMFWVLLSNHVPCKVTAWKPLRFPCSHDPYKCPYLHAVTTITVHTYKRHV